MTKNPRKGLGRPRRLLITSLLLSLLLHFLLLFISYLLSPGLEQELYPVRLVPYRRPPKRFARIRTPDSPTVSMEMFRLGSQPKTPEALPVLADTALAAVEEKTVLKQLALLPLPDELIPGRVYQLKWTGPAAPPIVPYSQPEMLPDIETALLRIKDLDTGRYGSIIILDPADKRALTGYINLNLVSFEGQSRRPLAIANLARYTSDHTGLWAKIEGNIYLSSPALFRNPLIFMFADDSPVRLSSLQRKNLAEYLRQGGFLFAEGFDESTDSISPFIVLMKGYLREELGREARFIKIPKTHSLYHSFYDFNDGPPRATTLKYLEGVELNSRLAVVLSSLGLSEAWNEDQDPRSLQFGVNLLVHALSHNQKAAPRAERPVWLTSAASDKGQKPSSSSRVQKPVTGSWFALVRTPPGEPIDGASLRLFLDGKRLVLSESGQFNGILLSSLEPGEHQLRIAYTGQTKELSFIAHQDKVSLVTFGVDRYLFAEKLRLKASPEPLTYSAWEEQYQSLNILEISPEDESQR